MTIRFVMIKSNAVSGKETAYEDWYNSVHLKEIFHVPGFVAGRQFRICGANGGTDAEFSHLAILEIEDASFDDAMAALGKAFEGGHMTLTDALDAGTVHSVMLEATGDRQTRS